MNFWPDKNFFFFDSRKVYMISFPNNIGYAMVIDSFTCNINRNTFGESQTKTQNKQKNVNQSMPSCAWSRFAHVSEGSIDRQRQCHPPLVNNIP